FLDVRMPKLSAVEVVRRARHKPAVIFTTAFDQYAVTAFELQALDYLLKPFGRERFLAALDRARWMLQESRSVADDEHIRGLSRSGVLERLFLRERSGIVPILVKDIVRIEANDDYAELHANGRRHLVHVTMNALEARLDPDVFVRVHRSHMVNLDHVVALEPYDSTRLAVKMSDRSTIVASRRRSKALKERAL
ncbi:MAG: LytTR family DNA-binding domain-containing protein, partial [Gemmatimonadales bacterium]